ncbi:hypothetical protein ACWU4D_09285 [Vibrio sp. WJH972]
MDLQKIAADAVELVTPSIEALFKKTCRKELHIVVVDPRIKPWESTFEDAILYEKTLGNPEEWQVPFDELARQKAAQAWRNNSANISLHTQHPSSLRSGDVLYYGSFVYGDIVVGCSGVEPWFDMLAASWVALAIEQLCISDYQETKRTDPTKRLLD